MHEFDRTYICMIILQSYLVLVRTASESLQLVDGAGTNLRTQRNDDADDAHFLTGRKMVSEIWIQIMAIFFRKKARKLYYRHYLFLALDNNLSVSAIILHILRNFDALPHDRCLRKRIRHRFRKKSDAWMVLLVLRIRTHSLIIVNFKKVCGPVRIRLFPASEIAPRYKILPLFPNNFKLFVSIPEFY